LVADSLPFALIADAIVREADPRVFAFERF
jgi:hypothetical protein